MSDGRALTDWRPSCEINESLKQQFEVKSDSEYRSYLQTKSPVVLVENEIMIQTVESKVKK